MTKQFWLGGKKRAKPIDMNYCCGALLSTPINPQNVMVSEAEPSAKKIMGFHENSFNFVLYKKDVMKKLITPRFIFITIAILVAAFTRVIPHPFNFTAIGAIALFGGAMYTDKRFAFVVPIAAMLLSDLILGFHNSMIYVYVAFIIVTLIGMAIRNRVNFGSILTASLVSSFIFYVVTNFGAWAAEMLYPMDMKGLLACYWAGLAFYDQSFFGSMALNTVMGDLFFNGLLFGSFALAKARFPELATQEISSAGRY
jgi:hypothetical protein